MKKKAKLYKIVQHKQQYSLLLRKFVHDNLPKVGFELWSPRPQAGVLPIEPALLVSVKKVHSTLNFKEKFWSLYSFKVLPCPNELTINFSQNERQSFSPKAGQNSFFELFSTFFAHFKLFSVISHLKSSKNVWNEQN